MESPKVLVFFGNGMVYETQSEGSIFEKQNLFQKKYSLEG